MRRIVVGERDIVVLEQAQRDVLAIRLAVRTVVDIRYDKSVNISNFAVAKLLIYS